MSKKTSIPKSDPISVQVNNPSIRSERVNLKSCSLEFVPKEKAVGENLTYELTVAVFGQLLVSEIAVKVRNDLPENNDFSQILIFSLVGLFTGDEGISPEQIADFGKNFTFSILWPYAREFAQDMFQRTGFPSECLPIINAQETTKKMIENDLIKVQIIGEGKP